MKTKCKPVGLLLTIALIMGLALAGCGKAGEKSEPKTTENPAAVVTPEDTDQRVNKETLTTYAYVTDEMYEQADCFSEGDISRILYAMQKAQRGEKVTIGVIGGSITMGSAASTPEQSYAGWFKKWWELSFPEAEVEFVNAGIGATTSYLGVHRVEEDLLSHNPDMVIVEFSVNDSSATEFKQSYDNLCRRILLSESQPALLLLFTVQENGTSAIDIHGNVGFRYNIPMLNYGACVQNEIREGRLTWKEISPDNIHPNNKGHQIIGEILFRYLNKLYLKSLEGEVAKNEFATAPANGEYYMNARILNNECIEPVSYGSFENAEVNSNLQGNWQCTAYEEPMVFELTFRNLGIAYEKYTKGAGTYEIYIDGERVSTLIGDFEGGWGDYAETTEVFRSKEEALHRVEIRKADTSTSDRFALLALLVS